MRQHSRQSMWLLILCLTGCTAAQADREAAREALGMFAAEGLVDLTAELVDPVLMAAAQYHEQHGRWPRDVAELATAMHDPAELDRYEGLVIERAEGEHFAFRLDRWATPDGSLGIEFLGARFHGDPRTALKGVGFRLREHPPLHQTR